MSFHLNDAAMMVGVLLVMVTMLWSVGKLAKIFDILPEVKRKIVQFYLLLAVGFLFMCSQDNPILYVLPLTVIALSDTASALVGTKYARKRFTVAGGEKSLEGGAAFFTVTLVVSLILIMLLTDAPDLNVIIRLTS